MNTAKYFHYVENAILTRFCRADYKILCSRLAIGHDSSFDVAEYLFIWKKKILLILLKRIQKHMVTEYMIYNVHYTIRSRT